MTAVIDALVPVHLYGLPAEISHLCDIADSHDIPVLEDAAQAHGAAYDGERVGSLGDAACFSFYPTKNMTTAEDGVITTDRDDVRERAERFVNHGRTGSYEHADLGHNFRMTSVAAAMGRAQLNRLPEFNETRRANAAALTDRIDNPAVQPPVEPDGRRHVYHQYTVRTRHRD